MGLDIKRKIAVLRTYMAGKVDQNLPVNDNMVHIHYLQSHGVHDSDRQLRI